MLKNYSVVLDTEVGVGVFDKTVQYRYSKYYYVTVLLLSLWVGWLVFILLGFSPRIQWYSPRSGCRPGPRCRRGWWGWLPGVWSSECQGRSASRSQSSGPASDIIKWVNFSFDFWLKRSVDAWKLPTQKIFLSDVFVLHNNKTCEKEHVE